MINISLALSRLTRVPTLTEKAPLSEVTGGAEWPSGAFRGLNWYLAFI